MKDLTAEEFERVMAVIKARYGNDIGLESEAMAALAGLVEGLWGLRADLPDGTLDDAMTLLTREASQLKEWYDYFHPKAGA